MSEQSEILFDRIEKTECPECKTEIDIGALEPFSLAACPQCGKEFTVPARLANYRLLACLGSGGMGSVYRAYDETLAREVAIKVMKKSLGQQPEFLESFRREAQAAAKLNHPNIAQIYSFGQEKDQPYIVMEFVPGKHLDDLIEAPEPLSQEMVMKIGLDIADGLQLATASNLIHGDIKPGNILMGDRDSAKLVDFGIASSPDTEQTEIWGTPYYISPEKIKREKIDFRSDMYCLGGTLYHALTKHPPFDGEDAMAVVKARLAAPPAPLRQYRPDIDPDVERIVLKMLESDPAKRYASYGDLMAEIGAFLAKGKTQSAPAATGATSKRIIIKSRGSKNRPLPDAQAAPEAEPEGGRKGVVINKRGGMPNPLLGGYGAPTPPAEGEGEEEAKPKKSSPVKIIVAVLVLLLVGGGATVGVLLHAKASKAKAEEAARASLASSLSTALAPIGTTRNNAAHLAERISQQAKKASEIVAEAVKVASQGSAEDWESRITAEAPFAFEPFDDTIDVEPDAAGEAAPAEKEESKAEGEGASNEGAAEAAPAEGDAPAEAPAEDGEAAPAEDETPAEGEEAAEAEAPADAEETAEEAAPAPQEEAADEGDLEGIPADARAIFKLLAPIRRADAFAKPTLESIDGLQARAMELAKMPDGTSDAVRGDVEKNVKVLQALAKKAGERYGDLQEMAEGLDDLLREAKQALEALSTAATAAALEAERRVAEEKAAEEARAAREKQEAEEAARKAAEEAEIQSVRAIVPAAIDNISKWKFDPILRDLEKLDGTLKFKSAQKALKIEKRRVEGLKELKGFLVERLSSADKFVHPRDKWGVVSADARSVEIKPARPKDAKPQRRKWEELKPEQIVPMLIYYLGDKDKVKAIPLRERINAYIDMAVYFVVLRGDDSHAIEAAKTYCERASADSPSKKREVVETLYEIDFGSDE